MEKHHTHHEKHHVNDGAAGDIATERYQGPGSFVTGAGYVYISHLAATFVTAIGLGLLGVLASKQTVAIKNAFNEFGAAHRENTNLFMRIPGIIADAIPRAADYAATKIVGTAHKFSRGRINGNSASGDKATAAFFAGGLGGITGFLGSTIWGFAKGHSQGNKGKHQFERAQAEIKALREENEDQKKINEKLRGEYVAQETKHKDAAADAPKTHGEHHEKPHSEHTEHAAHHEAKTEHHTADHATQGEHKEHAHSAHTSVAHHGDKPQTQTHGHAHLGTVNGHAHEAAMA